MFRPRYEQNLKACLNLNAKLWRSPYADGPVDSSIVKVQKDLVAQYQPTSLIRLPQTLRDEYKTGHIFFKDESARLNTRSVHILGASWALHRVMCSGLGLTPPVTFEEIKSELQKRPFQVIIHVATDGRWGQAVALIAKLLGVKARIYVAHGTTEYTKILVRAKGCDVVELDGNYDDAVNAAKIAVQRGNKEAKEHHNPDIERMIDAMGWHYDEEQRDNDETTPRTSMPFTLSLRAAVAAGEKQHAGDEMLTPIRSAPSTCSSRTAHLLVQDTAWQGYEEIPRLVVEGYSTVMKEIDEQLHRKKSIARGPDMIVVPVGSGSLAQAAIHYFKGKRPSPRIVTVEPETAACLLTSLRSDQAKTVPTGSTVLHGMNRGTLSSLAWPVLRSAVDIATTITEGEVADALELLDSVIYPVNEEVEDENAEDGGVRMIETGPCSAATLAALIKLHPQAEYDPRIEVTLRTPEWDARTFCGRESVIVLLGTEGPRSTSARIDSE